MGQTTQSIREAAIPHNFCWWRWMDVGGNTLAETPFEETGRYKLKLFPHSCTALMHYAPSLILRYEISLCPEAIAHLSSQIWMQLVDLRSSIVREAGKVLQIFATVCSDCISIHLPKISELIESLSVFYSVCRHSVTTLPLWHWLSCPPYWKWSAKQTRWVYLSIYLFISLYIYRERVRATVAATRCGIRVCTHTHSAIGRS